MRTCIKPITRKYKNCHFTRASLCDWDDKEEEEKNGDTVISSDIIILIHKYMLFNRSGTIASLFSTVM